LPSSHHQSKTQKA